MEKFLRFLSGYVLVSIEGEQTERFLNLCKSRGIPIRSVRRTGEEQMTAFLSVSHFFMLRPIRSKTKVHIRVLEKHGLPFFFFRNKKRKAFFLGILLCICLMTVLSCHIWNIHIDGNVRNSTPEILEFLKEQGISHGIAKRKVNCSQIATMVRKKYPEITWVSAKMEGTRLILTIQEGEMSQEEQEEKQPCNLTADVEGRIVKMVTRSGIPLMKIGDTCKKGDILVLGRLDLMNDSQEVVRYDYVHADADVYVSHSLSYYYEFPMDHQAQIKTGEEKKGFYLKVGDWFLGLYGKKKENWRQTAQEYPLRITENFILPFSFGKVISQEYKTIQSTYTDEQAKAIARKRLQLYEEKLIEKGVQISENNVKIEINQSVCVSRGNLTVIEKIGRETPVEQQEQPQER
ncbi:MAG: sporulation protein YqfD [Eubacteriales bacterium]|nr:sporulation protein YqfD [Eubacteriales bacterium]